MYIVIKNMFYKKHFFSISPQNLPESSFRYRKTLVRGKKKVLQKILEKFSKIKKNILRTMVKSPAQTNDWLRSYGQKTTQKYFS